MKIEILEERQMEAVEDSTMLLRRYCSFLFVAVAISPIAGYSQKVLNVHMHTNFFSTKFVGGEKRTTDRLCNKNKNTELRTPSVSTSFTNCTRVRAIPPDSTNCRRYRFQRIPDFPRFPSCRFQRIPDFPRSNYPYIV